MKKLLILSFFLCNLASFAQKGDSRYFEMRIYYCLPGRLDALLERFQNNTTRIFEKHGTEVIDSMIFPLSSDLAATSFHSGSAMKAAQEA